MDELTFHNELHHLKQQVADMAMKHGHTSSPTRPHFTPPRDEFPHQLHDLKVQLANLDHTLANMYHAQHSTTYSPTHQHIREGLSSPSPGFHRPEQTLTSFPMQSLSDIRADAIGLDFRVTQVEDAVSVLEAKLEQMSTSRFTPASSVSSYGDFQASPRHSHSDFRGTKGEPNVPIPTHPIYGIPYHDEHRTTALPSYNRLPTVASLPAPTWSQRDIDDASMRQSRAELAGETFVMLHRYNNSPMGNTGLVDKDNAKVVRTLLRLTGKLCGFEDKPKENVNAKLMLVQQPTMQSVQDKLDHYEHKCDPRDQSMTHNFASSAELDASCSFGPTQLQRHTTTGGAAFRDQEIMRLDELLRSAQEDLAASEQISNTQRDEIARTQFVYRDREAALQAELALVVKDNEQDQRRLNEALQAKEQEVQSLCDSIRQSGQDSACFQHDFVELEGRNGELEKTLRDLHASMWEKDQRLSERSIEVHDLRAFCDKRDAIAREQDDVIARGAQLFAERDNEISDLTHRLAAAENVRYDQEAAPVRKRNVTQSIEHHSEPSPGWDHSSNVEQWPKAHWLYPAPVTGKRRLSNEKRKAAAWEPWEEFDRYPVDSRKSSPIAQRRTHNAARRADESEPGRTVTFADAFDDFAYVPAEIVALPESERVGQSLSSNPVVSDRSVSKDVARHRGDRHGRRNDRTLLPPLPAPVPPPRMHTVQSTSDMRSTTWDALPSSVRKHQSMHDLPQRRLQAYVETEESDGDTAVRP